MSSIGRLYKSSSLTMLFLATLPLCIVPTMAQANPEGGTVATGSATISQSGRKLDINQQSDRVAIDWRSFDIAPDETTQFYQPNSGSLALNRVNSNNASQIFGTLIANGNVIIVNQNGVMFGAGSQINIGGLIATTADITNQNFMDGNLHFDRPGSPTASIINEGTITAREAGLVGFVAPNVRNSGAITANLGRVHLASGDTATVDFYGDQLMEVAVSDNVTSQLVTNTGKIEAAGGKIAVTAAAGSQIVNSLITVKGELKAPAVAQRGGEILIYAEGSNAVKKNITAHKGQKQGTSKVIVEANIDVSGKAAGEKGGTVQVLADHVKLENGTRIDASGDIGGGTVHIGGEYQGLGETPNAINTIVEHSTLINANALTEGNGGRVILWSDGNTEYFGTITARGGNTSGDGGLVETSGHHWLNFSGWVDTLAPHGKAGNLLLDPTDIMISSDPDSSVSGSSPFAPSGDNVTSVLNVTTLQNALASGSVTVQTRATGAQQGNITVGSAITWSANNTLTLSAANKVIVNAAITGPKLTFSAVDVDIAANISDNGASASVLTFTPSTTTTTLGLAGGAGTFSLSTTDLGYIQNGWESQIFGNQASTVATTVNAYTWNAPVSFLSSTGNISFAGDQDFGSNNVLIKTRAVSAAGNLRGTGTLNIQADIDTVDMNVGNTVTNEFNMNSTFIGKIQDSTNTINWTEIVFGSNTFQREIDLRNVTFYDNVWANSGSTECGGTCSKVNIGGPVNFSGNNFHATMVRSGFNSTLTSAGGTLTADTITGGGANGYVLGGAGSGNPGLSTTELNNIIDGWAMQIYGSTTNTLPFDLGAYTYRDPVTLISNTGAIVFNGAVNMGSNALLIRTNGALTIGANLSGTGTLTIQPLTNATMGLGASASGTINLDATELGRLVNGFSSITFGSTTSTGAMDVRAATWNDNVTFLTGTGGITFNGAQSLGGNTLLARTVGAGNITISASGSITSTAANTPITLSSEGNFINSAGSGALSASNGRWLVYSANPTDTTGEETLSSGFNRYGCTYTGGCAASVTVPGTGNGLLYTYAPTLTVTANNLSSITYGDAVPTLSGYAYTLSGYLGSDSGSDSVSGSLTGETTYAQGSDAGTYNLNYSSGSLASTMGYVFSYANNSSALTVGKRALTATMQNQSVTYGNATPTQSPANSSHVVWSNLYGSDTGSALDSVTFTYGGATAGSNNNVGSYTLGISAFSDNNYSLNTGAGVTTSTLTINPATLTITATAANKTYGAADPGSYAYNYSGLVNGDLTASFTGALSRAAGENAGTYAIGQNNLTATGNYIIGSFTGANFTITPAALSVIATAANKTYGDADPTYTYTYNGLVNGDSSASFSGSLSRAAGSDAGVYAIGQNNLTATGNYTIGSFTGANFTINKGMLSITADSFSRFTGQPNPEFTGSITGFINGENISVLSALPTYSTAANATSTFGMYAIVASGAAATNYNFNYIDGVLTISGAVIPASVTYVSQNVPIASGNNFLAPTLSIFNTVPPLYTAPGTSEFSTPNDVYSIPSPSYNFYHDDDYFQATATNMSPSASDEVGPPSYDMHLKHELYQTFEVFHGLLEITPEVKRHLHLSKN